MLQDGGDLRKLIALRADTLILPKGSASAGVTRRHRDCRARPISMSSAVREGHCCRSLASSESVGGLFGDLGLLLGVGLVKLHQLCQIELGLLEDLDLLDEDVLEGEDLGAVLSNLLGNSVGKEILEEISEG
jgi:hypothetical protein